jgi:putative ABC transport system permease protein
MQMRTLVLREIFERKSQLFTSFLAILLGITVIVSIKNITHYSEAAVAQEMDSLGANVLVLPKTATLQDYYNADIQSDTIPEEYVAQLALSKLEGIDNVSPKLSVPVQIKDKTFTLTGILPMNEFQAKKAWGSVGVLSRPIGCGSSVGMMEKDDKKTLSRKKIISTLEDNEVLVGADVAAYLGIQDANSSEADSSKADSSKADSPEANSTKADPPEPALLELLGKKFIVTAVLPATGTVDDARVFAHLHTVQDLAKKGPVVNAIEIIGCCQEISQGLVEKLNIALPDAKVVTVSQIVQSQQRINGMMSNLSLMFLVIIVFVGGASIANYMYANVFERRREIGTLMALGADSHLVLEVFLLKALLLGGAGGIGGYVLGSMIAFVLGPELAGIRVWPMWELAIAAMVISVGLTLIASFFPARSAARLDPCATFQEV